MPATRVQKLRRLGGQSLTTSLADIALVAFDVDGVLTDGRIFFDEEGREMHAFHARDGLGMVLASLRGVLLAAISGRYAPGVKARLVQLRVTEIHLGISDKTAVLEGIAAAHGIDMAHTCFIGDDVNDLGPMGAAGIGFAVADAHTEVLARADRVLRQAGGQGAVREVLDAVFRARRVRLGDP